MSVLRLKHEPMACAGELALRPTNLLNIRRRFSPPAALERVDFGDIAARREMGDSKREAAET